MATITKGYSALDEQGNFQPFTRFLTECNALGLLDPVDGTEVIFNDEHPIIRSGDNPLATKWSEVNLSFKLWGSSEYGDIPTWHEVTCDGNTIFNAISDYNRIHNTNYELVDSRCAFSLSQTNESVNPFRITYNEDTKIISSISLFNNVSCLNVTNYNFTLDGEETTPPSLTVTFEGGIRYKGSLHFLTNYKGNMVSPTAGRNIGKFNDSYFNCNVPIFDTNDWANDYIENGFTSENINHCINFTQDVPTTEDVEPKFYYYSMTLFTDGVREKYLHWDLTTFAKVNAYKTDGIPYNIEFNTGKTGADRPCTIKFVDEDGVHHEWTDKKPSYLETITSGLFSYIEYEIYDGSHIWSTNVTTNLPLWNTKDESTLNLLDRLPDSDSVNGGKDLSTYKIRTGSELSSTDNNEWGFKGFTRTFKLSLLELDQLGGKLWSTDSSVWEAITNGTHLNNNPIDVVVGAYYYPINIDPFVETQREVIMLGGLNTGLNSPRVTKNKVVNIGSTFIKAVFNNALDFSNVTTTLYLPFVGFCPIDFSSIINTTLSIDVTIDATNGALKYYIKSDNKVISEYGCNFGASMPITGSDSASKEREVVRDGIATISGGASVLTNVASGNYGGAISNLPSMANSLMEINAEPTQLYTGSSSSGTSCADPLYPFIIFDVQEAIIPTNLYSEYGYCSNKIGTIGSSRGWTECLDVKLEGNMLDAEKSEILQMLASGIII